MCMRGVRIQGALLATGFRKIVFFFFRKNAAIMVVRLLFDSLFGVRCDLKLVQGSNELT